MQGTAPELIDALILIVDDDVDSAQAIRDSLDEFQNVKVLHRGAEALALCRIKTPDLILLDVNMPTLDGLKVCRRIRQMSMLAHCPILFLSSDTDMDTEVKSWEAGGSDFLRKPIVPAALKMRVMSHLTAHWHIEISNRLYHTDTLTGLNNRYFFDKHVKEQVAYATRYNSDLSLLLVDFDNLRRFNQSYGRSRGDNALKKTANAVRKSAGRVPDSVCRYGGEEFTVLLPGTGAAGAGTVKQNIINAVTELAIPFDASTDGQVSVSIGETTLSRAQEKGIGLFEAADQDLQRVKASMQVKVA